MLYLDTSCLPPYFTAEAASVSARKFFSKASGLALSLWTVAEFHGVLGIKLRAGAISASLRTDLLVAFEGLVRDHIECWPLLPTDFHDAAAFCDNPSMNLRAADALHLAVARRHKATLVSLDTGMLKAAKSLKIPTRTF